MLSNKKQKYFQALWKTFRWRMAQPSKVSPASHVGDVRWRAAWLLLHGTPEA